MSRKKSLSLLLAFALTVTSTVAAFAGDVVIAKNTNDEVSTESTQSEGALRSLNELVDTPSSDSVTVSGLTVRWTGGVYYDGEKPTADDLDVSLTINKKDSQYAGCTVPVKSVKIIGAKKGAAGAFKFKVKSLKGQKYVVSWNEMPEEWLEKESKDEEDAKTSNYFVGKEGDYKTSGLSSKQQKAAYKELKNYLKQVKSHEFTATVVPRTIYEAIDKSLLPKKGKKISYECYEGGCTKTGQYLTNDVSSNHGLKHVLAVDSKNRVYAIEVEDYCETVRLQNGGSAKIKPVPHNSIYPGYVGKYKISYKQIKKKYVSYSNGVLTINDDNYAVVKDLKVRKTK